MDAEREREREQTRYVRITTSSKEKTSNQKTISMSQFIVDPIIICSIAEKVRAA